MTKKLIKIYQPPLPPERQRDTHRITVFSSENLADVCKRVHDYGGKLEQTRFYHDYNDCHDSLDVIMDIDESDVIFNKRMEKYEKDLAIYNDWKEKNKDLIDAEMKRREEAAIIEEKENKRKRTEKIAKDLVRLEREKKRLEKELQ